MNEEKSTVRKEPSTLRYLVEFLFASNLTVGTCFTQLYSGGSPKLDFMFVRLKESINTYLHVSAHSTIGAYVELMSLSTVSATVLFLLLRLLEGTSTVRAIVYWLPGLAGALVAPLFWLCGQIDGEAQWSPWLVVEAFLCGIWALLQAKRALSSSLLGTGLVFALHFGLWGWVIWRDLYPALVPLLVPGIGFLSCMLWVMFGSSGRISAVGGWAVPWRSKGRDSMITL
jgi:hypothetical protein